MKFQRLRLAGFKSFADEGEVHIERGLTGVVGPNGCGKSNLVEALRWVMGESSYKAMRGSGMDDVIFSGNQSRASKMNAEVAVFLDNRTRRAPAGFNDTDEIEISRKIERGAGSVFRVNGREARAKDVQLLFADASTGARSNALVRQGQISELISQKPQARRRILEEAAGIAGLHTRRHEAELRLKAAEQNLDRLDDVMTELDSQLESLKRQARQATRYRNLSDDILRAEAGHYHLRWLAATEARQVAGEAFHEAQSEVSIAAARQAETAKDAAVAAQRLPDLRDEAAKLQAAVQRISLALKELDAEDARIAARESELSRLLKQNETDQERETRIIEENAEVLSGLQQEDRALGEALENSGQHEKELAGKVDAEREKLAAREGELTDLRNRLAESRARRKALEGSVATAKAAFERASRSKTNAVRDQDLLQQDDGFEDRISKLQADVTRLETKLDDHDREHAALEKERTGCNGSADDAQTRVSEARSALRALEAEIRTLEGLLEETADRRAAAAPVIEAISVKDGYERAVAAAFGENLNAPGERVSGDENRFWVGLSELAPADWPDGVEPLSRFIDAPDVLKRRISHIGIADDADGPDLQKALLPGQVLVSVSGNRWAWDGYTQRSDAPTVSAQKLANRNRLKTLRKSARAALQTFETATGEHEKKKAALADVTQRLSEKIRAKKSCETDLHNGRRALMKLEQEAAEKALLREAARQAVERCQSVLDEAEAALRSAEAGLSDLPQDEDLEKALAGLEADIQKERDVFAALKSTLDGASRERELRVRRREAIAKDVQLWTERAAEAREQLDRLKERHEITAAELSGLEDAPNDIALKRRDLLSSLTKQKEEASAATAALQEAEIQAVAAEKSAKDALSRLSEVREAVARTEERLSAAKVKLDDLSEQIADALDASPGQLFGLAGFKEGAPLPDAEALDRRLQRLKAERERLGGVNLMADKEAETLSERRESLVTEHEDLVSAINQLRGAIGAINRESRQRLTNSFETVNTHFQTLFTRLFNGGEATLELVGSDDMLEAGLEIVARPPGKKPQTLSLLSGGEQALTATALIFAVFLTNPSPICVLDEVDAPLDDANVERLCDLLSDMTQETDTRFLIITHNPLTMARMNRLFGVTMREKGVSQLVSVDLEEAEAMVEPKVSLV